MDQDDFPYPSIIRDHEKKKHKKRLTQDQVNLLESNFIFKNKLDPERKSQLAAELGVPPRQVAIWYQNKRARDKIQGLEMDHKGLQLRLESVQADNARLREEVDRLKLELNRIRSADQLGFVSRDNNMDMREFYASLVGSDSYHFFA